MSANQKPVIAIIGAGQCSDKVKKLAYTAGKFVAQLGGTVVCGGLGGVMEAAAQGAKEGGGTTIGIIPTANKKDANKFIDYVIVTGMGEARNALVIKTADAIIAFEGKFGTLSEIAFALQSGKPTISVGSWDIDSQIIKEDNPEEAVKIAFKLIGGMNE